MSTLAEAPRPKRRGPTSWRCREWRPAAIAVASRRPRPSGRWSIVRPTAGSGGCRARAGRGHGGHCRCAGVAAALVLGGSGRANWHGLPPLPRGRHRPGLGRRDRTDTARGELMLTRAFSGRAGLKHCQDYVCAAACLDAPSPASYPVQRGLTGPMRGAAIASMTSSGCRPGPVRRRPVARDAGRTTDAKLWPGEDCSADGTGAPAYRAAQPGHLLVLVPSVVAGFIRPHLSVLTVCFFWQLCRTL